MHFRQAVLIVNNKTYTLTPGRANSFEEIYVDFQNQPEGNGERWSVFLHPKKDVTVRRLEIQYDLPLPSDARFFANGYQSWSESRLYGMDEAIGRLSFFAKKFMGYYGDEHIPGIPRSRSYLHSWTYTYLTVDEGLLTADGLRADERQIRNHDRYIIFLGSMNESTGFTLFLYDRPNGILTVRKDMDGLELSHSFPALDFWVGEGSERAVFNRYFQLLGTPIPVASPAIGWTSWYNHFSRISEAVLTQNLDSFSAFCHAERSEKSDKNITQEVEFQLHSLKSRDQNDTLPAFFQIDDGWQTAVGDWLSVQPAFPQGMGAMAQTIRARGLSPGLWLAPFVAEKDSELVRKHPDWLLKDKKGKPLRVGWNPVWRCWYYALDFYNNEVRNYLGGVFHTVLDRWGFDLVKPDFLFAACLVPPPGKTRGQVMYEAMEFLRKLAGPKKILACGVPLGAAFGFADYCRIGGDMHLAWEHRLLSWLRFRERIGALASLRSTLGRWQLNGRAFLNDPDVFILRNENQKLTSTQQQTVLTINALLGSLLFTSDDFGKYSPEQRAELEAALELRGSRILAVTELKKDFYRIEFDNKDERYHALCNLSNRLVKLSATAAVDDIELLPFETIILNR